MIKIKKSTILGTPLVLALLFILGNTSFLFAAENKTFLIHAKTSLQLDDAQICTVPNIA